MGLSILSATIADIVLTYLKSMMTLRTFYEHNLAQHPLIEERAILACSAGSPVPSRLMGRTEHGPDPGFGIADGTFISIVPMDPEGVIIGMRSPRNWHRKMDRDRL